MKDPRLARVAKILENKKISLDMSHKPVISGVSPMPTTLTDEKMSVVKQRVVNLGSSAAPMKATKMMTVKLKPSQVSFKSTETKVIKKE